MIKLKSLFRRGGGGSQQASSSSKYGGQSADPNANPITASSTASVAQLGDSNNAHLKGSSSTSNIDGLGLSKADKKKQKDFGSRDNLDKREHKSSKDRLVDNLRGNKSSKANKDGKRHSKPEPPGQMSVVQQPHQQQQAPQPTSLSSVVNSAAYEHQRPTLGSYGIVDASLAKELTAINFDGPHEDAKSIQLHELRLQLDRVTTEKMAIETKLAEMSLFQTEVMSLRNEMTKMKTSQDTYVMELQRLTDENESLRTHLRDVVHSPLSDSEKRKIINESQRLHNSAPASIALPLNMENADGTPACSTPDWDKHSQSSEISVACLQDKINQMEETHHSTNEELQATLQELADLQSQLSEIQSVNERLADEKDVLFQSLCRQTEKLEDSRTQIGTLQELLLRETNTHEAVNNEREQKLLELLKNAQEERENLLVKQEELSSDVSELRANLEKSQVENKRLNNRISILESSLDANAAERKQIESQLGQAREEASQKQIELSHLSTLLDNARAKIEEYDQERLKGDKSDLSDLLDVARKEKDILEGHVASLQEQNSKAQCEIQKLRDQLAGLSEECKVLRNNAKCAISEYEYKNSNLTEENKKLASDNQALQDTLNEMQVQVKCHAEDKMQLELLLTETQRHLGEAERLLSDKEEALSGERALRKQESEEWQQFQSDLLMTVRVANDFKTEAQSAHEQLVMDNKNQREKIRQLEAQVDKLTKMTTPPNDNTEQSLLNTMQQEITVRRQKTGILRQDSRLSVKSLIESIENAQKHAKNNQDVVDSHCSSTSSINSLSSDNNHHHHHHGPNGNGSLSGGMDNGDFCFENNAKLITFTRSQSHHGTADWIENNNLNNNNNNNNASNGNNMNNQLQAPTVTGLTAKSPLREQQQQLTNISNNQQQLSGNKGLIQGERKDPLNTLVVNGGSKRNALLKWCQNKLIGYRNVDITNFSSSWNDGLAFCALLHSYLPDRVPYDSLGPHDKRQNFAFAFAAAESVGIQTSLNINEMCQQERPDWQAIMSYVTTIYKHFEL